MRPQHFTSFICCLALIGTCRAAAPDLDLESRVEGFQHEMDAIISASTDENDWSYHGAELDAACRRWFPDDRLGTLIATAGKTQLTNLFYATLDYLYHAGTTSERAKLEAVFARLEEKGWADDDVERINYWGTPSFYFMKDGRLVKKIVGWPEDAGEERKRALRAGLRAIGVGAEQ